jgi:hypothetical protein
VDLRTCVICCKSATCGYFRGKWTKCIVIWHKGRKKTHTDVIFLLWWTFSSFQKCVFLVANNLLTEFMSTTWPAWDFFDGVYWASLTSM